MNYKKSEQRTGEPANSEPAKWEAQLRRISSEVQLAFGGLSPEQLNFKPNAATWSIAQNLAHLITINESYYPIVEQVRKGTYRLPFLGKIGFVHRFFGNFILKAVLPTTRKKMKTFPIWEPQQSAVSGDIVQRFAQHQTQFIAFMLGCQDLVDKGQLICSPASRTVVYTLEKAFEIIAQHEQRHLDQALLLGLQQPEIAAHLQQKAKHLVEQAQDRQA